MNTSTGNDTLLGTGTWPAVQFFRSAALFLDVDETGTDFIVSSRVLADWVVRFDHWYKQTAGIMEGERLHLVYHREVAIVGDLPLEQDDALVRIGEACRRVGLGYSLTFDLPQSLVSIEKVLRMVDSGVISSAGVRYMDPEDDIDDGTAREFIETLLTRGCQLGLIGPVSYWRKIGVLGGDVLNRSNITVYPRHLQAVETLPFPQTPVQPCFGRFRIYVDVDGGMYPCLGLLGLEQARLGTIFDEFESTQLGSQSSQLNLAAWARQGPEELGPNLSRDNRQSGLPPICERHRMTMSRFEAQEMQPS